MLDKKGLGRLGLLTGIGALVPMTSVDADVITLTKPFTVSSSVSQVTDPGETSSFDDRTTSVTFDPFDASLGTLTQVQISLTSSAWNGLLSVQGGQSENNDNSTSTWDSSVTLTMPGVPLSTLDSETVHVSCDFGNCSNSASPSFSVSGLLFTLSGASIPSAFTGVSDITATLGLNLTVSVANNFDVGTAVGSGSATWAATDPDGLRVTYTYTPLISSIPEPSTLALLGFGVAGLIALRKRPSAG